MADDLLEKAASDPDRCPHPDALAAHVRSFAEIMTCRQGQQELDGWLSAVEADDQPELRSSLNGIRRDKPAVTAGLTLPYSSATRGRQRQPDDQTPDVRPRRLRPAARTRHPSPRVTPIRIRVRARNLGQIHRIDPIH